MEEDIKILIVDDDELNLKLLGDILRSANYRVEVARYGTQALQKIQGDGSIKMVLLDVMMPAMDGFEVCRRIRHNKKTKDLPVIMITALDSPQDKAMGIASGADDILTKPVYSVELLARVKNLLEVTLSRQQLERAYGGVHSIIAHSEYLLSNFDPMWFDFQQAREELINMVFSGLGSEAGPEVLYIVSPESNGKAHIYRRKAAELNIVAEETELVINNTGPGCVRHNHFCTYNYGNYGTERLSQCEICLPLSIINKLVTIKNHVIYQKDGLLILAINFPRQPGLLQGQLLKGLAMQLLLYRTIYLQTRKIREAFIYMTGTLARVAEAVDCETGNHILRVGEYSRELARQLGLSETELKEISYSAQMHDVGKINISPGILLKPGPLAKEEFMEMENHTVYGVLILGDAPYLEMARLIALYHHERWDGTGYPYGIKGEEIPLPARIVAVADVYDALRSKRPYKPPFDHYKACRIILDGDGRVEPRHFSPEMLKAFETAAPKFADIYERLK